MPAVNLWAVLLAAVSAFMLGGLWYGPLFKNAWCREAGVNPDMSHGHPAKIFGGAFVLSLIAAYVFALLLTAFMTLIVSAISTVVALGFAPNFFRVWAGAWLSAWAIAFPALLAVRPFVQRMTNRLTGTSTAPGAQGSVNRS